MKDVAAAGGMTSDRRLLRLILLIGLSAGMYAFVFFVKPGSGNLLTPPCPFHAATGFLCPGCGTTRALHELVHGDFLAAVRLNPLLFVTFPLLGYVGSAPAKRFVTGRWTAERTLPPIVIAAYLALMIAFWIGRNMIG